MPDFFRVYECHVLILTQVHHFSWAHRAVSVYIVEECVKNWNTNLLFSFLLHLHHHYYSQRSENFSFKMHSSYNIETPLSRGIVARARMHRVKQSALFFKLLLRTKKGIYFALLFSTWSYNTLDVRATLNEHHYFHPHEWKRYAFSNVCTKFINCWLHVDGLLRDEIAQH